MKAPTRFIKALSQEHRSALNHLIRNQPSYRTRTRAHTIWLSARRSSINQIADIFAVDRKTIRAWLEPWEETGTDGLDDEPRAGRPTIVFRGAIDASVVIDCFETFSRLIEKETWVVIDNAPSHISEEFEEELERWAKHGWHLYFWPSYCPELNLIEHLWRKIKYEWLPLSAFA